MKSSPAASIAFVLVEPQFPGNIGACARALKNCGFRDFRLVRPPTLGDEAIRMACGSREILDGAGRFETLDEAIADARLVAAFTARDRRDLRPNVSLEEAAGELVAVAAEGPVALLFGREDRGLTGDELEPAQLLVRIPAAEERLVYNLSQAVLLAAYQLRRAIDGTSPSTPHSAAPPPAGSLTAGARRHIADRIRETLTLLGYDDHPDRGLLERIVHRANRIFDRAGIDDSDQAMLLGVLRRIDELARGRRSDRRR